VNTFIAHWLQDQMHECPDLCWDFPDDFDADKAHQYLLNNFNSDIVFDHLENLLSAYLRQPSN
tara:strand:+ start:311 stop:499 length:189 start_codon:yes stop_codon:yes gene_type:complete